ncbi:MAG: alkaline phosphatase family protein [Bdellovibrionales bacterium]|nr:alkaline phosphatase family protein [Bdellovibrionales bacterium]
MIKLRKVVLLLLLVSPVFIFTYKIILDNQSFKKQPKERKLKIYWFIPDGFRADPIHFNVYKWATEGDLPNIKKMMEEGSYGYSIPQFPSHTPVNFATLLTGTYPDTHGISDGPIRLEGYPLKMAAIGGFKSTSKLVNPMWYDLEKSGERVALISVPGSTPPELDFGLTVKGRWGGWGFDFTSTLFQQNVSQLEELKSENLSRVFYTGPKLTQEIELKEAKGWVLADIETNKEDREVFLGAWGIAQYALLKWNHDRNQYSEAIVSTNKKKVLTTVSLGAWSDWIPVQLSFQTKNPYDVNKPTKMGWEQEISSVTVDTYFKARFVLGEKGKVRIRYIFDSLNESLVAPSALYDGLVKKHGPFVDFVDNFPPQLVFFPEDKEVFIEELEMSAESHRNLLADILASKQYSIVVQNIYSPNQMLTSRWWMGYLDPKSDRYYDITENERNKIWLEVKSMYKRMDEILGEALRRKDDDTYIVLSSDHGVIPLNYEVRLNNFFAKKGWLKYSWNEQKGQGEIDWSASKVVFLNMYHIFINPKGLGGVYKRASGPEYELLRNEVIETLKSLKGPKEEKVVYAIEKNEYGKRWRLPQDRIGDLIVAAQSGFHWVEDLTIDSKVFSRSKKSGYKQAVDPKSDDGLLTPFMVMGPNVKKGYQMPEYVNHIDQLPTIFKLLETGNYGKMEGAILSDILTNK